MLRRVTSCQSLYTSVSTLPYHHEMVRGVDPPTYLDSDTRRRERSPDADLQFPSIKCKYQRPRKIPTPMRIWYPISAPDVVDWFARHSSTAPGMDTSGEKTRNGQ